MKKRLLTLLAAAAISLSAVPFGVYAEEPLQDTEITSEAPAESTKAEWKISDGQLYYVKLNGETSFTVPDEVTVISSLVFNGCTGLVSVTFPDGLKTISKNAFCGCTSLEEVAFPEGLEKIDNAFAGCSALKKAVIPESVTEITGFTDCSDLIIYGKSNSYAAVYAQKNNIKFETIDADAPIADIADSIILSPDKDELWSFPENYAEDTFTVPDGVKVIKQKAFENCDIEKVILPESLEKIEDNAFKNCSLKALILPEGLRIIGKDAFAGNKEIKNITIPESVIKINQPFTGCSALEEITFKRADTKLFENYLDPIGVDEDETLYVGLLGEDAEADNYRCKVYVPDAAYCQYANVFYTEQFVDVIPESMREHNILTGDVNGDNDVSIADAVKLQNYLVGKEKDILWFNSDLIASNQATEYKEVNINAFDFIELKKMIINNSSV